MCKTLVSDPSDPMARGLNQGILLLFALPFVLVAVLGVFVWLGNRPEGLR